MALIFRVDEETGALSWDYKQASAGVTEQQAMVIATSQLAHNLGQVAAALFEIAAEMPHK